MNETHLGYSHLGYFHECVLFIFWEKLLLYNFVSGSTDLYASLVAKKNAHILGQNTSFICWLELSGMGTRE